jgi:NitT/TauT family transport system permease protein
MTKASDLFGWLSPKGRVTPIVTVVAIVIVLWYLLAIGLNYARVSEQLVQVNPNYTVGDLLHGTWTMERPVLPAPDQIAVDLWQSTAGWFSSVAKLWNKSESFADFWNGLAKTGKRYLPYHVYITASATLIGFAFGAILGVLLAAGIVHVRTLERSLMPWIIASQTIPILAIAPMVILILANIGVTGLRSPDPQQMDLLRTYNASQWQVFWKLRVPASIPFLFASLKVAIAISLVGAIVGELPTGAEGGLGARMLASSYYGQMVQIWSALLMAAMLGMALVYLIAGVEWATLRRTGGRA